MRRMSYCGALGVVLSRSLKLLRMAAFLAEYGRFRSKIVGVVEIVEIFAIPPWEYQRPSALNGNGVQEWIPCSFSLSIIFYSSTHPPFSSLLDGQFEM